MKKGVGDAGAGMRAAMDVCVEWLDVTYPASRESLRANSFRALLNNKLVAAQLKEIQESPSISEDTEGFARVYVLPKGEKLDNILVDQTKPMETDWEVKRYSALCELVREGTKDGEFWDEQQILKYVDGGDVTFTEKHHQFIA